MRQPRRMRILLAIKGLAVEGGGAERVFAQLASGLHMRGHDVQIATFDAPDAGTYYDVPDAIPRLELNISPVGKPTRRSAMPRGMWRLRHHVRATRPDIVVAFMHSSYVPVALALAGTGVPVVASEHTSKAHFRGRRLQQWLVDMSIRCCALKTVLSLQDREEENDDVMAKTIVMPNPIDLSVFSPAAISPDARDILALGYFRVEKDFPTLIDAFALVAPDFPGWRLRIIGDGDERPRLENTARRSGVADRVDMPGRRKDVAQEYREAAFVAVPSLYEGFGLTTAEALASARPVIGFTDCAGTAALIEDGQNGLLIDPGADRVAALAKGLQRMMQEADLRARLGTAGPASVAQFSLHKIIDRWEMLLQRVADGQAVLEASPVGHLQRAD